MDKMFWMSVLIRFVNDCPALPKPYWTLMGPIEALQTSPVAGGLLDVSKCYKKLSNREISEI